jgi:carbon-monoxide dehydrogenase large subunit
MNDKKSGRRTAASGGIGASVRRKEDGRHLHGRGEFVADIRRAGMLDVAFLRSPVAHGHLRLLRKPQGSEDRVFFLRDLAGVKPICADSALPGFKSSVQPVLAGGKVRYVGEPIAACAAPSRAEAEDLAETIDLDIDPLPAVSDMLAARAAGAPLVHDDWGDNVFLETFVESRVPLDALKAEAAAVVKRRFRTARQSMAPIEGRGAVAEWDRRLELLTLTTATQMPHIVRSGLAECLGLPEGQIRVIAPDVGGGFGYKGILLPEEVVLAWLAIHLDRPVRWIEDRREQLTANANCREHYYDIQGYAAADGRLLAVECEATVDAGANSAYPFSACLEAAQIASILPGPYDFPGYRCRTWSSATNKPPILPYRGVARTGVCFALEVLLDALARELGMEPHDFRLKNLVRPEQMPFDNVTQKHFDSGDYPECLRRAVAAIDMPAVRARQADGEKDGRRIGVGFAIFCEQAAHGTSVYSGWGIPMVPGHEQASLRMTPDGGLEIRVGVHSHGQGLETTLAQVAHEMLGVDIAAVKVVHGDTAYTPYSTGTWGSRCAVMAGGAVAAACERLAERIAGIGAHLLQAPASDVALRDGRICGPSGSVSLADVAKTWYRRPQDLPPGIDPQGLEVTEGYKPVRDSGTFSYACHAAVVAVDTDLGDIEILDYAIAEDGGVLINPMVVDGQVYGGMAQGIGTALYEEVAYDANGQPLASTLADYHLPGAGEVPTPKLDHMETPSPYTWFGQKGLGEGGAIGPPAAIANAVNDALAALGVEVTQLPITPERLLAALADAKAEAPS